MKTVICVLLFFLHPPLFGISPLPFSLHQTTDQEQLKLAQDQYIEIKGFLYKLDDGALLLAAQPHLKSCCIGKASRANEQLVLRGLENPPQISQAVTVRGIFRYDANENRMELLQTQLVGNAPDDFRILFLMLGVLAFSLLLLAKVFNRFAKTE